MGRGGARGSRAVRKRRTPAAADRRPSRPSRLPSLRAGGDRRRGARRRHLEAAVRVPPHPEGRRDRRSRAAGRTAGRSTTRESPRSPSLSDTGSTLTRRARPAVPGSRAVRTPVSRAPTRRDSGSRSRRSSPGIHTLTVTLDSEGRRQDGDPPADPRSVKARDPRGAGRSSAASADALSAAPASLLGSGFAAGCRVFISVDMEGIAGVVTGDQLGPAGFEYQRFREFMTNEVLAAIDGARARGRDGVRRRGLPRQRREPAHREVRARTCRSFAPGRGRSR